jgi:hypothetical protein
VGKNKNKEKKAPPPPPESGSGAYKCKGCDAYTFGAPYRLNGYNYCKYCLEKEGIKPEDQ